MAACRMSEIFHQHIPVLLEEVIKGLITSPDGVYIDATFGRGSHTQAILNQLNSNGKLIAFDKDPEAIAYGKQQFAQDKRFSIHHTSFAHMQSYLKETNNICGILFDLGVSSPQLDNPLRGFSFMRDGKLDMRMDTSQGLDAATWIAKVEEEELARVLYVYGEEKYSRRIAHALVREREKAPITTSFQLANIITRALPKQFNKRDKHPATRSFQAIRIAINQELVELEQGLSQSLNALKIGGRILVISFHSLEDRIVKQFIKQHEKGKELPRGLPVKENQFQIRLKALSKPIKPSLSELNLNPRARSAILRIAEKIS